MNQRYRITNWKQYNRSLIQRGSITFWIGEDLIKKWYSSHHSCKPGRPQIYSDDLILSALMLREIYKCPLRMLEGFMVSIMSLMGLVLPVPSYSQISRRASGLEVALKKFRGTRVTDIVFDSTGLKVYGEGEWKVRQHGSSKRRTWRKLHLAIDPDSHDICLSQLTSSSGDDATIAAEMVPFLPKTVKRVRGDGAYDRSRFRIAVEKAGIEGCLVPPPKNAIVHPDSNGTRTKRNDAVLQIIGLGGDDIARSLWKKLSGYYRRSLVETAVYRIKQLTGDKLRSRSLRNQVVEGEVKCLVINKINLLGMPEGLWEEAG